jgi:hypothetical protein
MLLVPTRTRQLRWLLLIYGIVTLLWLSREDNGIPGVVVLGCGLTVLLLVFAVTGRLGGRRITTAYVLLGAVVLGLVAGLGTAVTTTGLMVFKNSLHAHLFLDYPPHVVLGILRRAPVWSLAGGLTGLGLAFAWCWARHETPLKSKDGSRFS